MVKSDKQSVIVVGADKGCYMGRVLEAFFALDALILFKTTVSGPPKLIGRASALGTGILMAGEFNSGRVEANVSQK